jgi:hypothetical protein
MFGSTTFSADTDNDNNDNDDDEDADDDDADDDEDDDGSRRQRSCDGDELYVMEFVRWRVQQFCVLDFDILDVGVTRNWVSKWRDGPGTDFLDTVMLAAPSIISLRIRWSS